MERLNYFKGSDENNLTRAYLIFFKKEGKQTMYFHMAYHLENNIQ